MNPITNKPFTMEEFYSPKGAAKLERDLIACCKERTGMDLSIFLKNLCLSNDTYEEMEKGYYQLHPKKRKHWKHSMMGRQGERLKVIFKDGNFMSGDKIIISHDMATIKMLGKPFQIQPVNIEGEMVTGTESAVNSAIYNHTGNHAGRVNHTIKVPPPASTR
jgi:hypothetical protein